MAAPQWEKSGVVLTLLNKLEKVIGFWENSGYN